ncbi:MAG TPA: ABC transporter substrate-binding protein [bacterium (Candidatus Stahlbacteria)]|nr:ABC transporter substrate-binding protein [Candidatus Stahlbacteria bacterium]
MKKLMYCLMAFLACMLSVMPALADGIPADTNSDNNLTENELATAIRSYMLGSGDLSLEDLRDAAHVYVYWNGEPKIIVDSTNHTVTIYRPVKRLVAAGGSYGPEAVLALGAKDKLVGVASYAKKRAELELLLEDVPGVGSSINPDVEAILALDPDIVQGYACFDLSTLRDTLEGASIPLVQLDFSKPERYFEEIRIMGRLLDKEDRAEELINFEEQYLNLIAQRVAGLEDDQKPKVYMESYGDYQAIGPGKSGHDILIYCGGVNIFDDIEGTRTVSAEEVVMRNPQVIIKLVSKNSLPESGYGVTNTTQIEELRNTIMTRPAWDSIDAVKNGRVYIISTDAKSIHGSVYYSYIAKWLHPNLFEDINPIEIHRDWMETFLGIEYTGVYGYPTNWTE